MIKEIINTIKKANRIYALSEKRNLLLPYGLNKENAFGIEISKKAFDKLKTLKGLHFSLQANFKDSKNGAEGHYLVVEGMNDKSKYDFTYSITGNLYGYNSVMDKRYYVSVTMTHIDVSMTIREIEQMLEMIGIYLDNKYGNDCGFSLRWNFYEKMFFAESKYSKLLTPQR